MDVGMPTTSSDNRVTKIPPSSGGLDQTRDPGVGTVQLLRAEKFPAGYQKMIRAQVVGELKSALLLFTPDLDQDDVLLADPVLEGPCATLMVGNKGVENLHLDKGTVLGGVVPINEEHILDATGETAEGVVEKTPGEMSLEPALGHANGLIATECNEGDGEPTTDQETRTVSLEGF